MTPTNFYYLGLYLLVFVIRFFKIYKEYSKNKASENDTSENETFKWQSLFFVSLEIVYTSAGFIIVLLENSKEWIAAIVIFYIILVLISSNLDSLEERFNDTSKFIAHLIIIMLVVGTTLYSFSTILKPTEQNKLSKANQDSSQYKVAIPYSDNSLDKTNHRLSIKKFQTIYVVNALNITQAIARAKSSFWNDSTLTPFFINPRLIKKKVLTINEVDIVVQKIE